MEVELSIMFVTFFSSLFLALSVLKRIIQINTNKLKKKNEIIAYFSKDIILLKNSILFFLLINVISVLFFFNSPETFSSISTNLEYEKNFLPIIATVYFLNFIRLIALVFDNKIKIDIFYFVVKDQIILTFSLVCLLLILILK